MKKLILFTLGAATIAPSFAQTADKPRGYFISQFKDRTNVKASATGNDDCGTTSLVMVGKHFGRIPNSATRPQTVENTIHNVSAMMMEGNKGGYQNQIVNGAQKLGLNAQKISPNAHDVSTALNEGKLVIAGGDPMTPGAFGPKHGYVHSTSHYIVITEQKPNGNFVVFDPAGHLTGKDKGIYQISKEALNSFLSTNEVQVVGNATAIGK